MAYTKTPAPKAICICLQCSNEFEVEAWRVKRGTVKYCSKECTRLGSIKRQLCKCGYCGKRFEVEPAQIARGQGKYCSNKCSQLARFKIEPIPCLQCGRIFKPKGSNTKYCCKTCANTALVNKTECTCKQCGTIFYVKPSHIRKGVGKYCSRECYTKAGNKDCICVVCGNEFRVKSNRLKGGGGRYCSYKCFASVQRRENHPLWRGGTKRYRGENWHQQRKLAYERDGGICQYCHRTKRNDERQFSVHHIKPFREFNGDYLKANVITLCHQCHPKAEHGKITLQAKLL